MTKAWLSLSPPPDLVEGSEAQPRSGREAAIRNSPATTVVADVFWLALVKHQNGTVAGAAGRLHCGRPERCPTAPRKTQLARPAGVAVHPSGVGRRGPVSAAAHPLRLATSRTGSRTGVVLVDEMTAGRSHLPGGRSRPQPDRVVFRGRRGPSGSGRRGGILGGALRQRRAAGGRHVVRLEGALISITIIVLRVVLLSTL